MCEDCYNVNYINMNDIIIMSHLTIRDHLKYEYIE